MDAQSGRLVVVSSMGGWAPVRTTSYDVCANTWEEAPNVAPWWHESWSGPAVVYDPGTDSLIALSVSISLGQAETYSTATRRWGPSPQKLLPWAYSVDLDRWARLPPIRFPEGVENTAVTHAVMDPTGGRVLFLLESAGSRTLWSYSPGWQILRQLGGQVPAGRSGDPSLILDTSARRLVLILPGEAGFGIPGETWTFDLFAQTWTDQHAEPPRPGSTPLAESRQQAVFDPVSQQTFVVAQGLLFRLSTGADDWEMVVPGSDWPRDGWGTGPLSRTGHTLVHDPVNRRILMFGGSWQTDEGTTQSGDVWAYDVPTNTWTELVPATAVDAAGE